MERVILAPRQPDDAPKYVVSAFQPMLLETFVEQRALECIDIGGE